MSVSPTIFTSEQLLEQWAISALQRWQSPEEVIPALVHGVKKLVSGTPASIISADDLQILRPDIRTVIEKLLKIVEANPETRTHRNPRWAWAMNVPQTLQYLFVDIKWWMTQEELNLIPLSFFQRINPSLWKAIANAKARGYMN